MKTKKTQTKIAAVGLVFLSFVSSGHTSTVYEYAFDFEYSAPWCCSSNGPLVPSLRFVFDLFSPATSDQTYSWSNLRKIEIGPFDGQSNYFLNQTSITLTPSFSNAPLVTTELGGNHQIIFDPNNTNHTNTSFNRNNASYTLLFTPQFLPPDNIVLQNHTLNNSLETVTFEYQNRTTPLIFPVELSSINTFTIPEPDAISLIFLGLAFSAVLSLRRKIVK